MKKNISGWVVLLLVALLASCHTERQTQEVVNNVLSNQDAFAQLGNYWQILHPCINKDSTGKPKIQTVPGKTTVKHDTTYINGTVYFRDSIFIHDTTFIDRPHYITDTRAVQQAKDSATKYKALYEASQSQIAGMNDAYGKQIAQMKADHEKEMKAEKKRGDGWMWKFWGLVGVCIAYAGFKTGIIGKLLKLLKIL